jgi:tetratricopeptide (TPR) repeat protein
MMEETVVEGEEWTVRAEEEKAEGNRLFKEGKLGECIEAYSRAIALDVDNHVLYSNRSAAYLKKGDSKSKALKDAEKCVSLMPEWTKGYNRMGAAQQALGRYDAAVKTFEKGLALGEIGTKPDAALTAALKGCREAQVAWQQQKDEAAARAKSEADAKATAKAAARSAEDPLADFFSELGDTQEQAKHSEAIQQKADRLTPRYTTQELGTGVAQYTRLCQKNHQWRNLNPYTVLDLGVDATEDDIKQRYKKMAVLLHPDKLQQQGLAVDDPKLAFTYVKTAHLTLLDPQKRRMVVANINAARESVEGRKESKMMGEGAVEEEVAKATMKVFADIELQRRKAEELLRSHQAREKAKLEEEKRKEKEEHTVHKVFNNAESREKRVGNWRSFAPGAKKPKSSS